MRFKTSEFGLHVVVLASIYSFSPDCTDVYTDSGLRTGYMYESEILFQALIGQIEKICELYY